VVEYISPNFTFTSSTNSPTKESSKLNKKANNQQRETPHPYAKIPSSYQSASSGLKQNFCNCNPSPDTSVLAFLETAKTQKQEGPYTFLKAFSAQL